MFAVPGWKISAPLKPQTAPIVQKNTPIPSSGTSKPSKKRKRGGATTTDNDEALQTPQELPGADQKGQGLIATKQKVRKPAQAGAGVDREPVVAAEDTRRKSKARGGFGEGLVGVTGGVAAQKAAGSVKSGVAGGAMVNEDGEQEQDAETAEETASSKRRKRRKKQKEQAKGSEDNPHAADESDEAEATVSKSKAAPAKPIPAAPAPTKLTPLQSAMRQKLVGSRFRYLNETLYTTPSSSSAELFKTNPNFFVEYHEGFARQVEGWPENPVDGFVNLVLSRASIPDKGYVPGKIKGADKARLATAGETTPSSMGGKEPLPRDFKSRVSTIADLGCGSASFAQQLQSLSTPMHLKVHSFDLAAPNEHVTVADIRSLPLADNSVDVAVFSLALMGTNWIEFIEEAWRILRWKGECWVADVNSRFAGMPSARRRVEHSVGARHKGKKNKLAKPAEESEEENTVDQEGVARPTTSTDVGAFIDVLKRRGFALVGEPDLSNKMFARMRFIKAVPPTRGKNKAVEKRRAQPLGRMKFIDKSDPDDNINVEDERKVLKPCVYKIR